MSFSTKKSIQAFAIILLLSLSFISCSKEGQDEKVEIAEQLETLLDDENLKYLENSIDFMEYATLLKKLGAPAVDCIGNPEQYDKSDNRAKMLIRFGMLCTDMAYLKIINGHTQTQDYDKLFQRYVADLNLSSIVNNYFEEYKNAFTNREVNDDLFNDLKKRFKADRIQVVQKAKNSNEDFLIYFAIGYMTEGYYILNCFQDSDKYQQVMTKFIEYLNANGAPLQHLLKNIWDKLGDKPMHKEYKEYLSKIKPAFVIFKQKLNNNVPFTEDELKSFSKNISNLRNEIMN